MTASINGNTPAYSVRVGKTLLATLRFAWPTDDCVEGDRPAWAGANEQSRLGFLKGMTWLSRRIVLAPPDKTGKRELSTGGCCYCGKQTDLLVRSIRFRPGWQRPFKEPWPQDPHLLEVTRKDARSAKAKEKKIVPSWPSPNQPLEDHAGIWRSVIEGHLQGTEDSETAPVEFYTTLLAVSQALYKHVGTHSVALPPRSSGIAHRLLLEMEWLRSVTWISASARGNNWRDAPKGHFLVGKLCARQAKGRSIRSGLCARSPLIEHQLEKALLKLANRLALAGHSDGAACEQVIGDWRCEVRGILRDQVEQIVDSSISGSTLRVREARQLVDDALQDAVQRVEQQQAADAKPRRLQRR